jgi:hypothetical protein
MNYQHEFRHHKRILFITKKNQSYGFRCYTRRSSGLFNSTNFIVRALAERGIHAHLVEVVDNNDIDREVSAFRPDVVVIEALWVVPEKFDVLKKLHPSVKWFVHLHSGLPFLALEGSAIGWLKQYAHRKIGIIANSEETYEAFRAAIPHGNIVYLPNVYLMRELKPLVHHKCHTELHVGCFGAIRPMKNQLTQAIAALKYCDERGLRLRFHINGTRVETHGSPVLKNLQQLFKHSHHELIEHHWMEPEELLPLLQTMDLGMQVSLTETFNVVCADYVTAGIPVVASHEIRWLSCLSKVRTEDINEICSVIDRALRNRSALVRLNRWLLGRYSRRAQDLWYEWVR